MSYLKTYFFPIFLVGVMVGCDGVSPVYRSTTGGYFGANITPKSMWSVRGVLANPAAAADDDISTSARSSYGYAGAELVIDLKKVSLFQTVILEHGSARSGHCRSVDISTSVDGKIFDNAYTAPGTRRFTIISLPAPRLARYVRIKVVRPGRNRWSIAEVYIQ